MAWYQYGLKGIKMNWGSLECKNLLNSTWNTMKFKTVFKLVPILYRIIPSRTHIALSFTSPFEIRRFWVFDVLIYFQRKKWDKKQKWSNQAKMGQIGCNGLLAISNGQFCLGPLFCQWLKTKISKNLRNIFQEVLALIKISVISLVLERL